MAAKKSKPQRRSRRDPAAAALAPNLEALHAHIEQARERLMDVEAVLDCVLYAIGRDDRMDMPGPGYSNVIRIVRGFVHSTVDQLDSVNIKAAIAASNGAHGATAHRGVRETPPAYLH